MNARCFQDEKNFLLDTLPHLTQHREILLRPLPRHNWNNVLLRILISRVDKGTDDVPASVLSERYSWGYAWITYVSLRSSSFQRKILQSSCPICLTRNLISIGC